MPEPPTSDTESSSSPDDETDALLRTPCAAEDEGGPLHPDVAKERGQTLRLTGQILAMTGDLLPTPRASDGPNGGPNMRGSKGDLPLPAAVHHLLPTPMVGSTSPAAHGQISGDFRRRMDEALRDMPAADPELMPTPSVADVTGGRKARSGARSDELLLNGLAAQELFGRFAPAIRRWEQVFGRPAPAPTERSGRGDRARLSPRFVEWMMGLPEGWVTDPAIGLTRSQQLKALGNGVVPQQGAAAISDMLDAYKEEA